MRPISPRLRKIISEDPYYKKCARLNYDCSGRITIEHAYIYAGQQIDELWNLLPLCVYHHLGNGLDKKENWRIALSRATKEDLKKYPKKNWEQEKSWLELNNKTKKMGCKE